MDLGFIMQAAGVGFIVTVLCQVLGKSGRDDQAALVSVCGIIVVLIMLFAKLGELLDTIRGIFGI